MNVRIAEEAELDIEAIGDFIARDNPHRALSFVRELRQRCADLATFPRRFPVLRSYEKAGIRKVVHGNYLILYRIQAATVIVVHVVNGAMDYAELLAPMSDEDPKN